MVKKVFLMKYREMIIALMKMFWKYQIILVFLTSTIGLVNGYQISIVMMNNLTRRLISC